MRFTSFFRTAKTIKMEQKRTPILLLSGRSLSSFADDEPTTYFFKNLRTYTNPEVPKEAISFLQSSEKLNVFLNSINKKSPDSYLFDHVSFWVSHYANNRQNLLHNYLCGKSELNSLCQDFIEFCFSRNIQLDAERTLQAFSYHNHLSDSAFKQAVNKLHKQKQVNIMGYGLDDGTYEQHIANYILERGLASRVNIYGFDPYANKNKGVHYLSSEQLMNGDLPKFDLVIARWVLHHVDLYERWADFMCCLKRCASDSTVLVLEHGFLGATFSDAAKRLYYLLNGTFDVVANIGLRPHFFTCTKPHYGAHFFIKYLESADFELIRNKALHSTSDIFDIGPEFPNQTVFCLKASLQTSPKLGHR